MASVLVYRVLYYGDYFGKDNQFKKISSHKVFKRE